MIVLAAVLLIQLLVIAAYYVNRKMEKETYSLTYKEAIRENCEKYALDFYLVAAVIHVESRNDPLAVSPKGAIGLMQIMPATGEWIFEKIQSVDKVYSKESLYEAETNIRYGCWYLRYLLDKFNQDVRYALVAYNAGPGNLDKWLCDERFSKDGELTEIPFEQTRDYVNKVKLAKEKYEELYGNENP